MNASWRALLLTLLAVVPMATPAHAYLKFGVEVGGRVVPVRWATGSINYFVTERDFGGVSPQAFTDAMSRAAATWNRTPGLPVSLAGQGLTRSQPLDADGRSTVGFLDRPDQERVLAATSYLLDAETGRILESDIYFNTRFRWSTATAGETGATDLESVALHEFGHLLGLGHSAIGETEVSGTGRRVVASGSVMFPIAMPAGSVVDRVLQADDIAGVLDLYDAAPPGEVGSIAGHVTKGGRGVYGAHVVAFHLKSGVLIGGFTLTDDGAFVIGGLAPGAYVVRVEPLDDADIESFFTPGRVDIAFAVTYAPKVVVVQAGGSTTAAPIEVRAR